MKTLRLRVALELILLAVGFAGLACASGRAAPIPVKVAVVVTFERGNDTGDAPGEFQFWAEREHWTQKIQVPGVDHVVYVNDEGEIGVVCGTTSRSGLQIMALVDSGLFDFTKTYWVFNGIAGVNPNEASIGSAAWAHYVIDGDVAYELDSRDADPGWPYAVIPIGSKTPNQRLKREGWEPTSMCYELNASLVDWAYSVSKDVPIPDSDEMKALRAQYADYPKALVPPKVMEGDAIGSNRYWHGKVMTQWAIDWCKLWSDGKATFVMTAMEEQGISASLERLSKTGKVDFQRLLVLRSGSNYCMPPPTMTANKSLHSDYAGMVPSLEAAYGACSKVVHALLAGWSTYETKTPTP